MDFILPLRIDRLNSSNHLGYIIILTQFLLYAKEVWGYKVIEV